MSVRYYTQSFFFQFFSTNTSLIKYIQTFFLISVKVYQQFLEAWASQGREGHSDAHIGSWVRNGGLNIPIAPHDPGRSTRPFHQKRRYRPYSRR